MTLFEQATNRQGEPLQHLSYSSLKTFNNCTQKWWYDYIEKPDVEKDTTLTDYGTWIHDGIETLLNTKTIQNMKTDQVYELLEDNPADNENIIDCYIATQKMLEQQHVGDLTCEKLVETKLAGKPFIGYIDVMARNTSGETIVIDHKISKNPKNQHQASYNLPQILTYAYIVGASVGILNYANTAQYYRYEFTEQSVEDNWQWLTAVAQKLLKVEEPVPTQSKLCGWCDYKGLCPAFNKEKK
jgi:CRISPR/Cas system-associated exonuclease Cas4 (RecB family)